MLGEQPHVEGRVLLRREGVAVAAHLVELLGDGRGGAPFRALEEQVLQEVRRPGELAGLVTRAGADPVGDRDRADIRHGLGDQADAARQDGRLDQRRRERPREGRLPPAAVAAVAAAVVRRRRPHPGRGRPGPPPARPRRRPRRTSRRPSGPVRATSPSRRRRGRPEAPSRADRSREPASPLAEPSRAASRRREPPPSGAEASDSDTLPCGSMSSTRTSTAWPSVSTSSTLLMRLPPASDDSFEMCSRPSRPGSTFTKAPNLVMLTTLPGVDRADLGGGRVEDQRDAATGLFDRVAVLGPDGHRADDAVVVDGDVRTGLLLQGVDDLALGADDLTDLVDRDLHGDDLRRAGGHVVTRLGDGAGHDLEDREPGFLGLQQRLGQHVGREAGDLGVELQRRHGVGRARPP